MAGYEPTPIRATPSVAFDGLRVIGYYALTIGSVHNQESPFRVAKGLANHPIGVVLLGRLAVDRSQRWGGSRRSAPVPRT